MNISLAAKQLPLVQTRASAQHDSVVSIVITGMVVLGYCIWWIFLREGGVAVAREEFKALNWGWIAFEVGLPLGLPVLFGLLAILGAYVLNSDDVPSLRLTIEELTPWTLCFFSLTIPSAALRRLYGSPFRGWVVIICGNLLIVSLLAASFTVMKHRGNWHAGFNAYSAAIFVTLFSIWMSHAKHAKSA